MQTIAPVTMFPCPITGKLYKTERGAKNSAKREQLRIEAEEAKRKEQQKSKEQKEEEINWLRLNLEDINDLPVLMKSRFKELYDWDLDVSFHGLRFGNVSNSHTCPIGGVMNWSREYKDRPTYYLGWSGRIEGTLKGNLPKLTFMNSISDIINGKFKGLHTGTGCPGRPNEFKMSIGFNMFLDDFPKLKEKYEKYLIEKEKNDTNKSNIDVRNTNARSYAKNHSDYQKALELFKRVEFIMHQKFEQLHQEYQNKNPVNPITLSDDYQTLKEMFQ
jgi:hypothetical protein